NRHVAKINVRCRQVRNQESPLPYARRDRNRSKVRKVGLAGRSRTLDDIIPVSVNVNVVGSFGVSADVKNVWILVRIVALDANRSLFRARRSRVEGNVE